MQGPRSAILLLLFFISYSSYAQDQPDKTTAVANLPSRFFSKIEHRITRLDDQLTHQTAKYLERMRKREQRMYNKLYKKDSAAAKALFAGSMDQYTAIGQRLANGTGTGSLHLSGEYQAYTDSLQGMLKFVKDPRAAGALTQLKSLEAKMQDADQVKEFVRQRKQQISQHIQQHTSLAGLLGKDYQAMNQGLYYYSEQVRQYKEMLNDPDKLTKQALALLSKLPAFQAFMKQNYQLAGLFNLPGNNDPSAGLIGLQTRDQVGQLIQGQIATGGSNAMAALQQNMQSAQQQLGQLKDRIGRLGTSGGDVDMPDFKPNHQKVRTFWKRLEYGGNFQTTRNNYLFPLTTDLGLSLGYRLNDHNSVGIGASYKIGWGQDIKHIALSNEGGALRSYLDIQIKGNFSATAGLEYNYSIPSGSLQRTNHLDYWSRSGLIGVSKIMSVKSRVFRKTKLQLLWDYLSYEQHPATQPILFRVGYSF